MVSLAELSIVFPEFVGVPGIHIVAPPVMATPPKESGNLGRWLKAQREARGWSASELANRVNGMAMAVGDPTRLSQQNLSKFEQGVAKRVPAWTRHAVSALEEGLSETAFDPCFSTGKSDTGVEIRLAPTMAGLGGGGTGERNEGTLTFSRDLIFNELRCDPGDLLAFVAEGNSMEPDFFGGDQMLVHTRKRSLAQPGAFCLWDSDGIVIKYVEQILGSDPPSVRILSKNDIYAPAERPVEEINIIGRVIWFGRRVQ